MLPLAACPAVFILYFCREALLAGNWQSLLPYADDLLMLLGAFILALPIIITAVKDLINGKVYMNELVALAILAAMVSADFQTAGIIAFFLLVTIIIETRTASGAQRSIEELIKLTPNIAHKLDASGNESEVQVSTLAVGDRILVRPGENFPVDARIINQILGQTEAELLIGIALCRIDEDQAGRAGALGNG